MSSSEPPASRGRWQFGAEPWVVALGRERVRKQGSGARERLVALPAAHALRSRRERTLPACFPASACYTLIWVAFSR
jgi:hypothetical protein